MSHAREESDAISSAGVKIVHEPGLGCKLGVGTYYFDVSSADVPTESVHMSWDAAVTATVTFQDSNMPPYKGAGGAYFASNAPVDVSAFNGTAGNWVTEDPSTAYIPAGTGFTVTNMSVSVAGTDAGGTIWNLSNLGTRRGRMKVVTTVGGYVRCLSWGKGGA
jgi:hypothetical protein